MRVKRLTLAQLRDGEGGATVAIVAISLICLLGMLVLTFDLGRGVGLKRIMVNAADAGALAAARECGLGHGPATARTAAQQLVGENNDAATVIGFEVDDEAQCSGLPSGGKRQVTVTVRVPQEYFFAPIFGVGSGAVVASATAEWTTGVTNPAPLKLDELKVDDCLDGTPNGDGLLDCYFTFEKLKKPGTSQWGWLNLPEGWPVDANSNPGNCSEQAGGTNDLFDYISSMGGMGSPDAAFLPQLIDPTGGGNPPTYVCAASGEKASSVDALNDWVKSVQQLIDQGQLESEPTVLFPIVACDSAKPLAGPTCREWKYAPGLAYPVMKFQGFFVKDAWSGQQARKQAACQFARKSSDVFCIHLQTAADGSGTPDGSVTVRLVR
jgi:Flp pilus assembly protein TadG